VTYDIPARSQGLVATRSGDAPDLAWVEASTRDPAPFWSALLDDHAARRAPNSRSRLDERFDIYHDAIVRHLSPSRPALRWYEPKLGLREISYSELHAAAARRASAWAGQKVKTGDVIAIVLSPGATWLISLVTALRMGLCISLLFPLGDAYLAHRLAKLGPAHIATEAAYLPLLVGFEKLVLDDNFVAPAYPDAWYTYGPKELLGKLFSPLHAPLLKPHELAAQRAYLEAVRDGVLVYLLEPGEVLAAPGFHLLQHQPAMILATLLAGACFFHVPTPDLLADPTLLTLSPIRCLGVGHEVRDALLAAPPGPPSGLGLWIKNPEEPVDPDAWRRFTEAMDMKKVPASSLVVDAARGGAALFSVRRPGGTDWRVLPAPGQPYGLFDAGGSGEEAVSAHGIFTETIAGKPALPGYMILARTGPEYGYGGTTTPRRDGRIYPADEVTDLVGELPFVAGSIVVPLPSGGPGAHALFTLVVFTGAAVLPDGASAVIAAQIELHLGREFLPDRTEIFPLYPRLKKGKLDQAWCETQLRTGLLSRKAREPMFLDLTALRKRCVKDISG
jgi:hypothetical protein